MRYDEVARLRIRSQDFRGSACALKANCWDAASYRIDSDIGLGVEPRWQEKCVGSRIERLEVIDIVDHYETAAQVTMRNLLRKVDGVIRVERGIVALADPDEAKSYVRPQSARRRSGGNEKIHPLAELDMARAQDDEAIFGFGEQARAGGTRRNRGLRGTLAWPGRVGPALRLNMDTSPYAEFRESIYRRFCNIRAGKTTSDAKSKISRMPCRGRV